MKTDDLNIREVHSLVSPAELCSEFSVDSSVEQQILEHRQVIRDILSGQDPRLMVVLGPCSIHDPQSGLEYAQRLAEIAEDYSEKLFLVMRVYFEKPRTIIGWKGLISDPDLDNSFHINKGLRLARKFLCDVTRLGLPTATEFLDSTFGQYYTDLISLGAIGARTAESQVHRELASALSMPVGFKNRTDGDIAVALDAIQSAQYPHCFPSLSKQGEPAILETKGNRDAFLILRGGNISGPNYDEKALAEATEMQNARGINLGIVVDCSHGNSNKKPENQVAVAADIAHRRKAGDTGIAGIMLESHLKAGRQDIAPLPELVYGQSITDACIDFEETLNILKLF